MSTRTELVLQKLVNQTASQHAQELHLVPGQSPVMRQDGKLQPLAGGEVVTEDLLEDMLESVLTEEERQQINEQKSVTTIKEISSLGRFKLTFYYQRSTLALTLKRISTQLPRISDMQLPQSITQLAAVTRGLVLISGPFDSGRSTLAAVLLQQILQTQSVRIMTLERPLEYILESGQGIVEQRDVSHDVTSFEAGLDLVTQEDVDVVFVSEVSNVEVAQSLTRLALSDRLVVAVLDSDSAVRTVEMFITQLGNETAYISDFSDALHAVVNVRLLPRQGVPGRIYATEVLLNNPAMRLALRDRDVNRMQNVLQTSRQEGMTTLDQSLLNLVGLGHISKETALSVAHDQTRLGASLQ